MENIFASIFSGALTVNTFLLALAASMLLGLLLAITFMYKNTYSKSFVTSLVLIPIIETVVIMLVNDNLGVGLTVAGSFALIRFRSVKGNAKELATVFTAMTIGIICGTGYIALGALFTIFVCIVLMALTLFDFGKASDNKRYLKITIPESLNYDEVFDETLKKYTSHYELEAIKTLTLGSLFRVEYNVDLKNPNNTKQFIDELRTLNGNLEIMFNKASTNREEL